MPLPPQFFALYKRDGHRVLINKLGDLVVRPSYVETAIRKVPGGEHVCERQRRQLRQGGFRCEAARSNAAAPAWHLAQSLTC